MKDGMAYAIMVEIIGLRFSIGLGIWIKENDGACVMLFHSADIGHSHSLFNSQLRSVVENDISWYAAIATYCNLTESDKSE